MSKSFSFTLSSEVIVFLLGEKNTLDEAFLSNNVYLSDF
jgi:hypothetical protein